MRYKNIYSEILEKLFGNAIFTLIDFGLSSSPRIASRRGTYYGVKLQRQNWCGAYCLPEEMANSGLFSGESDARWAFSSEGGGSFPALPKLR